MADHSRTRNDGEEEYLTLPRSSDAMFFICGLLVGGLVMFATIGIGMPDAPQRAYNEQITLPVEAFGANLHVKNFRKNVPFPDGFDDALKRAIAAYSTLDRPATITMGGRIWTLHRPIDVSSPHVLTLRGADRDRTILRLPE